MRVLFLSQRVPYPPNRGDKITSWRMVQRLGRKYEVSIVAFAHDQEDVDAAEELTRRGYPTHAVRLNEKMAKLKSLPLLMGDTPLTLGVYGSKQLQALVDEIAPSCSMGYAFSSSMGAFLEKHSKLPRVMHFAELDSDKWLQYSQRTGFPMNKVYRREWRTLLAFEKRIAYTFDANVLCTPTEMTLFREQIPGAPCQVIRNGVDVEFYQPDLAAAEPKHMVFVGVMNYLPNVDGCVHFVEETFPLIRAQHPDARFTIVGSKPSPEVLALAEVDGVEVTGFVDDTRDYLRKACLSVAPLRIARGIQNKVLEAMAMGLPVVGSTSATQGVEGKPGEHFLLADTPQEQCDAVCQLFDNNERALELGRIGRKFVEDNYDWEATLRPLDELATNLTASQHAEDVPSITPDIRQQLKPTATTR